MKLVGFLLRSSRQLFALAIITGLIAGISNTGLLVVINVSLSKLTSALQIVAWSFVGLCLLMLTSRVLSGLLLIRLSQGAIYDLRMELSRQLIASPLRHLESLGAHRVLATLTDDVNTIALALFNIPLLCMHFAIIVSCLIYLCWLSWKLLLILCVFLVFGVLTYNLLLRRAVNSIKLGRAQSNLLYKHFRALTEGTKELKLHRKRREAFLSNLLEATAISLKRHTVEGNSIYTLAMGWGQLLVFAMTGLLLLVLPAFGNISTPVLVGYTLTILYLMTPLEFIIGTLPAMGRAGVAMQTVEALGLSLAELKDDASSATLTEPKRHWQSLQLLAVTHDYHRQKEDSNFILGPITMSVYVGELIFIVGGNGSGKTTLTKLLAGLYIPESGTILLDGEPINESNREYYRQHFSAVFSDFYLFESLLGIDVPETDGRVREYLVKLQLDHKVKVANGTLSTIELSQGERKRLALLTAYVEDRPIYIFDEWAADQDPRFKNIFYLHLLPELKARGKTVLVISHDDRYYHLADRLIKLNYGQIEPEELASDLQHAPTEVPVAS